MHIDELIQTCTVMEDVKVGDGRNDINPRSVLMEVCANFYCLFKFMGAVCRHVLAVLTKNMKVSTVLSKYAIDK